jgi:hypothetical protein
MKFIILSVFRKYVEKIQVSLKSDKNNGYFTLKTDINFLSCLAQFFLEWKKFQTDVVENIKTHILRSVTFIFRKSCHLYDNVEKYFRAGQATDDKYTDGACALRAVT